MARTRICGTVDADVAFQVTLEHRNRTRRARLAGDKQPNFSRTLEDVLKKGILACMRDSQQENVETKQH